ncbi:MAG: IS1634 family transposase [Candidatus Scalindua sp.]|nr:IS1634 family transposase [Candidatus Scalindua sp.]
MEQGSNEEVAKIEPGYNPQGEWVNQLKLFALSRGDSGLPVGFETRSGGAGDSPAYVPEFEALCKYAELSTHLPLDEVILIGDRKMATKGNQLIWLRENIGYIGPQTITENDRKTLHNLLAAGEEWTKSDYVPQREEKKAEEKRNEYQYLGRSVSIEDEEGEDGEKKNYQVRQVYVRSAALAAHETKRRKQQIEVIENEIQRIAGIVNKYDYKTAEIIAARVQKKAFKKRGAQKYFTIKIEEDKNNAEAPLRLTYAIDQQQVEQDAELAGIYMLVAGAKAATLNDNEILKEWKGQYKVEHRFRMIQEIFLAHPIFLKKPDRIVSLIFLIMVGSLVAGLIERQVRRAVAEQEEPIQGLMPEGRDTLRPTIGRIFKAFAHYSLIRFKEGGKIVRRQLAKLDAVQQQILALLGLPEPAQIFGIAGQT